MSLKNIILASASPRRKELMKRTGFNFTVKPSQVPEMVPPSVPMEKRAAFLAELKAAATSIYYPKDIIIGADTTVLLEGELLGKPKDEKEAAGMLRKLSGKVHTVITGVSIIYSDQEDAETFSSESKVEFYELSEKEIEEYVASGEPMDKAGAYGIQGRGFQLVKRIEGDFFSVMGLPIAELVRRLKAHEAKEAK